MTIVKQMKELGFTPKLSFFIRAPDAQIWSQNLGKLRRVCPMPPLASARSSAG